MGFHLKELAGLGLATLGTPIRKKGLPNKKVVVGYVDENRLASKLSGVLVSLNEIGNRPVIDRRDES